MGRRERYAVDREEEDSQDVEDLIPRFKRFKLKPSPAQFRLQTERDQWLHPITNTKLPEPSKRKHAHVPCIQPEQLKATWTSIIAGRDDENPGSVDFEFLFQSNYPHVPPRIRQISPLTTLPGLSYADGGFLVLPFDNWVPVLDMSFCMDRIQDALNVDQMMD